MVVVVIAAIGVAVGVVITDVASAGGVTFGVGGISSVVIVAATSDVVDVAVDSGGVSWILGNAAIPVGQLGRQRHLLCLPKK